MNIERNENPGFISYRYEDTLHFINVRGSKKTQTATIKFGFRTEDGAVDFNRSQVCTKDALKVFRTLKTILGNDEFQSVRFSCTLDKVKSFTRMLDKFGYSNISVDGDDVEALVHASK